MLFLELLLLDLKVNAVKEHLFGDDCQKVDKSVKEDYLKENYVAFAQIYVSTYSYVLKTDEYGDTVYYTDESCSAIAYDRTVGLPLADGSGKPILDEFGNVRYFDDDGNVAYDKVNGVVGYETEKDNDGNAVVTGSIIVLLNHVATEFHTPFISSHKDEKKPDTEVHTPLKKPTTGMITFVLNHVETVFHIATIPFQRLTKNPDISVHRPLKNSTTGIITFSLNQVDATTQTA